MLVRYHLSRLSRPAARRAFGRAWLGVCLAGAVATLLVLGARSAFFIAVVWLLCVFAPVRIAVELLHTAGPRLRRRAARDLARLEDRYTSRDHITLMVEDLFSREVRMPRLAPPDLAPKVIEAAVRLSDRAFRGSGGALGVLRAATTCGVLLERWIGAIAGSESPPPLAGGLDLCLRRGQNWAYGVDQDCREPGRPPVAGGNGAAPPALWDPHASIQDQWVTLRSVAGLAALTKTLLAVCEDSLHRPVEGGEALRAIAESAMDYADQVGLKLDGPGWEDVPGMPRVGLPHETIGRLAEVWTAFCAAPPPAPRRLLAFVDVVPE